MPVLSESSPVMSASRMQGVYAEGETLSSAAINLRRLVVLRTIALVGQALAIAAAVAGLGVVVPLVPIVAVLLTAVAVNAFTWWRLKRRWPVGDVELFGHFVFDVLTLTGVLYFAGGSTNPFAPLYLLPLTLAAATLRAVYTWIVALLTVLCYSLLLFYYVPLHHAHRDVDHVGLHPMDDFGLHVFGMWLGFLLSAGLIAHFVVRMRETLRERDRLRAQMREQELRDERLVALGTLAAGAAHELGTPLSTIAVLANDLGRDVSALPGSIQTLRQQVARCKEILASLSAAVGQTRAESGGAQALDGYLANLVARWRSLHPEAVSHIDMHGSQPPPRVVMDQTLSQALLNILNNAAEASPQHVAVTARWSVAELVVEVSDRGPGLSREAEEHAGEPFFTSKPAGHGMGLGLFLARSIVERLGGRLALSNRPDGGAVCRVSLPLGGLTVTT